MPSPRRRPVVLAAPLSFLRVLVSFLLQVTVAAAPRGRSLRGPDGITGAAA
ncbi:hypothetical protein [Nocardiopsis sp. MG754419]|uniref:hypothetical protein n=1 Tax=Nocardiopsis sp. MG754419 TaxID=2259865 RepID=UPI001BAD0C9D|nr:hypothetical protein [Nocardiopsis sp. MG754419]